MIGPRPPAHPLRRVSLVGLVVAAIALAPSCSSDEAGQADDGAPSTVGSSKDDLEVSCGDPIGDLEVITPPAPTTTAGDPATSAESTTSTAPVPTTPSTTQYLSEPAGVDVVQVDVDATGDTVDATFTVAGDITETTTDPTFVVFRGVIAGQEGGFELQAVETDGVWRLDLVDYLTNVGKRTEGIGEVTVDGSSLSFSVPKDVLPPLSATRLWSFGTHHGESTLGEYEVIDDCSPLLQDSGGASSTTSVEDN